MLRHNILDKKGHFMNTSENTILITGGTSGIGFEMAKQLLALGNTVVITGRSEEKLAAAKAELGEVSALLCDASNPDDIQRLYAQVAQDFPKLNILINNAGIMLKINLQAHDYDAHGLTQEIDTNIKGPIWMCDAFLPLLKRNHNAAIVNVSSGLAFVPLPISPIYCATKTALHFYSLSLREQLRNTNVQVFELAPPATQTTLLDTFDAEEMKGTSFMTTEDLVKSFIQGVERNVYEICPGQSAQLRFMSRFFPKFILKQLSVSVDGMHQKAVK